MTQTQITLSFLMILAVVALAMGIHSWIDKSRISKNFFSLAEKIGGTVVYRNPFIYPTFRGDLDGKTFDLFFKVIKAGRKYILYCVYSLKVTAPCELFLTRTNAFKPVADHPTFEKAAGQSLAGIDPAYQGHSPSPEQAMGVYSREGVAASLLALGEFLSLQVGPDALIAAKPYDGPRDTDPDHILRNIHDLQRLAHAIEQT